MKLAVDVQETSTSPTSTRRTRLAPTPGCFRLTPAPTPTPNRRFLHRKIQQGGDAGHDSCEDARAALDLALLKVRKGPAFGEPQPSGVSLFETLQVGPQP